MKKNIYHFNNLLRTYNKYRRKLANLRNANKNVRRQHILQNHLAKLHEKLTFLKMSIKLSTVAASIAVGTLAFIPQTANAQSFSVKEINPFSLTNSYDESSPAFADLDGDGDLDMLSGSGDYTYNYDPYTSTGSYEYYFKYYENIGTSSNPVFNSPQSNPFGIAGPTDDMITPTFVDIDGDGDMDLFYGNNSDKFYYLENIGTSTVPAFGAPQTNMFGLNTIFYESRLTPTFSDIDNDGDFDMISGSNSGLLFYRENTGTSSAPAFAGYQTNPFGLNPYYLGRTAPTFIDIDGDGDFDLLSGEGNGDFFYFENTGTSSVPAFAASQTNPFNLSRVGSYYEYRSRPTFADIDNDGDMDLMAGDSYGDFNFYRQCTPSASTISPVAACSFTTPSGQLLTTTGVFTDIIPNATGCDSTITINLTIDPLVDQTVSSTNPIVCGTGTATIDLGSSQLGINYFLRNDLNDTIVDGPIIGTSSGISFNTGNITSSTTYNVYGVGTAPSTGLVFDGIDDYVDAGAGINLANISFSIEFWAKKSVKSTGNDDHIIGLGENTTTNNALHIGFRGSNQFTFAFFGNDLDAPSNLADTNWHHWAVTYNKAFSEKTIYRDGVIVANGPSSDFTGTGNLKIGRAYIANNNNFEGNVDEVRVWSVARTQSEIQTDMNTCLTGAEISLLSYYQFEDGTGSSTLADATTNGNTGTLLNMDSNSDWVQGSTVCSSCNLEMTQTITINIGQPSAASISPTACNSYVSPSGNYTWTTSATYLDTIPNVSGCDSVITVNLTINNSTTGSQTFVECAGFSITVGTNTYNTTGIYTDVLVGSNGCDSTVTTDLTVEQAIDVTVDNTLTPTLSANQTGATYQWLDCDNANAIIPAETSQSFTATVNGNYAVEVTVGSCVDTSACENISTVGISLHPIAEVSGVRIYPNPNSGFFTISLTNPKGEVNYTITTLEGRIVKQANHVTTNNINVDLSNESKGVYMLIINEVNTNKVYKIIRQ